ncbi:MAG: hypothetical protein DME22_12610 [Verrucomicrobia bacterium]|nr:MAG: hypothetical protein DME22_12610 [Verrucomicrobiota bacterium]PYK03096.1 MAG: hypothetical protein DME23_00510 [Verrucomicrobiota bacterium]
MQVEFNPKTDADGRVVWDSAPDAELLFDISASGYMRVSGVKIRPDGEEHVITLPPALTIFGTVRDAETGASLSRFRIGTGWPNQMFLNGSMTDNGVQWSTIDRFWLSFNAGEFRHAFEEPVLGGVAHPSYVFKFEADGYAPFVSRTIGADEGEVRLDVTLQKAVSTTVTVRLPDGRPASGADVGLVSLGARLNLVPGSFSRQNLQTAGSLLTTDSEGRFRLPPDNAIVRVIVAHTGGFAEIAPAALSANTTLPLQPWGRLEGICLSGERAAIDQSLALEYGGGDFNTISAGSGFKAQTDAVGRFVFPQAPPGRHTLMPVVTLSSNSWTSMPLTEVEVRPGETTSVTVEATK